MAARRWEWRRQVEQEGLRLVAPGGTREAEDRATARPREETLWRGHSWASRGELDEAAEE